MEGSVTDIYVDATLHCICTKKGSSPDKGIEAVEAFEFPHEPRLPSHSGLPIVSRSR